MAFQVKLLNRPVRPDITSSYSPTSTEKAAERARQKTLETLREQFDREFPDQEPADTDDGATMEWHNCRGAAFDVWLERRKDRVAAVSTPVWCDGLDEWLTDGLEL